MNPKTSFVEQNPTTGQLEMGVWFVCVIYMCKIEYL